MTALRLYECIVGEGGVPPSYFLHTMPWWEVQHFITGLRQRAHSSWEQTRWLGWMVSVLLGNKRHNSPDELMPFPWEQTPADPEQDRKDLQALLEQVRAENRAKGFVQ